MCEHLDLDTKSGGFSSKGIHSVNATNRAYLWNESTPPEETYKKWFIGLIPNKGIMAHGILQIWVPKKCGLPF